MALFAVALIRIAKFFSVPVLHEDEVEDGVEARHHEVRHAQVYQKVVGHVAHPPMG